MERGVGRFNKAEQKRKEKGEKTARKTITDRKGKTCSTHRGKCHDRLILFVSCLRFNVPLRLIFYGSISIRQLP